MFTIQVNILKRIKIIHVKWFTKQKVKSATLQVALTKEVPKWFIYLMMQLATGFNRYDLYYCSHPLSSFSIVISDLLLWIGKRNSGPLQNVTQILSSMKSPIYSMLTLRKLLLEDADAESECCSFLERSSNKNSSWGAWSCTIVVSFRANTEKKQKKKTEKI